MKVAMVKEVAPGMVSPKDGVDTIEPNWRGVGDGSVLQ
jgi:hypothetical protein